jgi:uncharacterized protein YcbK (DUF882 family)
MTDERRVHPTMPTLRRRNFLRLGVAAAATAVITAPEEVFAAKYAAPSRRVSLLDAHTGETLTAEYWSKGHYVKDALRSLNKLLRDHRTGQVHMIDPKLFDLIHLLQEKVGRKQPFHIVSGYRSPATNALLHRADDSVATHSYHMRGMAIDLHLPGRTRDLYKAALRQRGGGVGWYPESDFVHVDVGPLRTW